MLFVYLGLVIGLLLIAYGVLSYTGSPLLAAIPILARKGDALWLVGMVVLGIAGLLGWVGYTLNADLRLWRIIIAVIGVVVAIAALMIDSRRPAARSS